MCRAFKPVLLYLLLVFIVLVGIWLRAGSILPANVLFDYDQYEDLFRVRALATLQNLPIIGPAIYSNPNLHHGVFYYYYVLIPFLLFQGSPVGIAMWNSVFNASGAIVIFILARSLFKNSLTGIIAALLVATSPEFVKYSGWLSNPTTLLSTVPLFFFCLWKYYKGKNWGIITAFFLLGIIIQSELFFLYLVPTIGIYWLLLKPKWPNFKLATTTLIVFLATISTFILTEIKLKFAGVIALAQITSTSDEAKTSLLERVHLLLPDLKYQLYYNFWPQNSISGWYIGFILLFCALVFLIKERKTHRRVLIFLIIYLLSPLLMLFVGYHQKSWFLISLPPILLLLASYSLSKLGVFALIPVFVITMNNTDFILNKQTKAHDLFKAVSSTQLSQQLAVIDYTYQESNNRPFAINTVTMPLYHNGLWEYNYWWYGAKKYKFLPGWLGGDQLPQYKILSKATGQEKIFYLIIENNRIPEYHKFKAKTWADQQGKLLDEKYIEGFIVQKRVFFP